MSSERGSASLFSIMLILLITMIGLAYLRFEIESFEILKKRLRVFTCMKKLNGESISHVNKMEILNKAITAAEAGKIASIFTGPAAVITYNSASAAKKGAQLLQQGLHISYMKKLWEMSRNHCYFDPLSYITPYRHQGLLSRDLIGRAQLRKKAWNQSSFNEQILLKTKVSKGVTKWQLKSESYEMEEALSLLKSL